MKSGAVFFFLRGLRASHFRFLLTFVTIVKIEEGRYMPKGTGKVIAQNKKAFHDYFIEET